MQDDERSRVFIKSKKLQQAPGDIAVVKFEDTVRLVLFKFVSRGLALCYMHFPSCSVVETGGKEGR